jgi:predicted O-methyltransferase YrrM
MPEHGMSVQDLPENRKPLDPFFGPFFQNLRGAVNAGSSEFGLGMTLFSLAVTMRADYIVEYGRFKGFSTYALASALRFLESGWQEPDCHKQRPDKQYAEWEKPKARKLISIDPVQTPEATQIIEQNGLSKYVDFITARSLEVELTGLADIIFIDGDHSFEGCISDVFRVVPKNLKPGGYFILHDYFGWYDQNNKNNSPIKKAVDAIKAQGRYESVLMDTGYMSFVVFRNPNPAID